MSKKHHPAEAEERIPSEEPAAKNVSAAAADDTEQLREEVARANDRALRAAAELENFRRRSRQQLDDERRYAAAPLIQSLLPVLDNIDRAINSAESTANSEGGDVLLDGFKIVASQLQTVLAQYSCVPIEALGEPFDPNWHEAILQQPSDEYDAGTVMLVTETGYKLHDRVLRPAKVIVSIGKADS
jgi:molecular chaperone GrpE